MKPIIIRHNSGEYPVLLSQGLLDKLPQYLSKFEFDKAFYIIDKNVYRLYRDKLSKFIRTESIFLVPPGESSKSYQMMEKIHKSLFEHKCSRHSLIIAIGGGVTGDLAGFAASTYMRGVKLFNVPTTLIAACDSAIGGKTGINFGGLKNVIGTFYQPVMVMIDPQFFYTLTNAVYRAGLGELIKYAYLSGNGLYNEMRDNFQLLLKRDKGYLSKVLLESISFKGGVVSGDEKESGLRKILNLGHTFAHGFESASAFRVPHGLAVHGGIIASIYLSGRLGIIPRTSIKEMLSLALKLSPTESFKDLGPAKVYGCMIGDKKNSGNEVIRFVLIKEPGCVVTDITASKKEVIAAIKDLQKLV